MSFQPAHEPITWRLYLSVPPETVWPFLDTDDGRARWWAESAVESSGVITFAFPGGQTWIGPIGRREPPHRFEVVYYGGTVATFELQPDGRGGTDLLLTDRGVPAADHAEVVAGWVSVLMALKAAVEFAVDLRNHDPNRSWDQGYADN